MTLITNSGQFPETAQARHEAVLAYLKRTAAELTAQSLSGTQSLEDWERKRPGLRQQLLSMLGLETFPQRTPLHAQITGALQRPEYRIEKLVFQSMPDLYVTGNLYIPNAAPAPLPAILYACGHSPHPLGAKWHYQDRAIWFASQGYVCLVLDTLEFGEVPGLHHGIHDLNLWHWLSLGYTPIGVEVWNAVRALDYLETRPEVDGRRIGMTGISGGGAATWFTAAIDARIAAAVPVCSTYTFGSQAQHWVSAGQCDCIYFHNTFLRDFPLVAALIAPRPLLICSGQRDRDFPPDGYHEVFRQASAIYALYAAADRIREVDADAGHEDAPLFLQEARRWMHRWLRQDTAPLKTEPPQARQETAEDLACLSQLPADAINYHIHDRFIPTAQPGQWTSAEPWQARREALMAELKARVFRWFPTEPIPFATRDTGDDGGWAARYAGYREVLFQSEAGVSLRAQLYTPRQAGPQTPLLLYAKRAGDSIYFLDLDELLPLFGRYAVLVLYARLTEHPIPPREYADIERTASWTGRTIAAMQVWDILRAVRWAYREAKLSPASLSVYGKGEMGILALYAGLLEEQIGHVILRDPPSSHWQGPALLNVLRVTDIPEAAAAFAPRQLTFLREMPAAFDSTRTIYRLCGQAGQIGCAPSLPDALEIWKYARS
ncbi:MAG TPA: acetylxylan esterase [Chthonomonadaceae bacterium]|nr:acetylxylan esterase [Chthonomonadaceae bacterium]